MIYSPRTRPLTQRKTASLLHPLLLSSVLSEQLDVAARHLGSAPLAFQAFHDPWLPAELASADCSRPDMPLNPERNGMSSF